MIVAIVLTLIVLVIVGLFICKRTESFVNTSGSVNNLNTKKISVDEICLGKYCVKEKDLDDISMGVTALAAGTGSLLENNHKLCFNDHCINPTDKVCYGENCLTASEASNFGVAMRLSNSMDGAMKDGFTP